LEVAAGLLLRCMSLLLAHSLSLFTAQQFVRFLGYTGRERDQPPRCLALPLLTRLGHAARKDDAEQQHGPPESLQELRECQGMKRTSPDHSAMSWNFCSVHNPHPIIPEHSRGGIPFP
jgi:hypothetical protein